MRLEGQKIMGFFAAPPAAIAHIAKHLAAPDGPWTLLDPCAGEGAAVAQLATILRCQPEHVHAIELDEARAETVKAALPQGQVLAPASITGVTISKGSIGCCWLNPPFDHGYGGYRVEGDFLERTIPWLATGAVLILVCPEDVATSYSVKQQLVQWFTRITVVPFPEGCRAYNEVAVLAIKRDQPAPGYTVDWYANQAREGLVYQIPSGPPPAAFYKSEPTELEIKRALVASPLRKLLQAPQPRKVASPPLALGSGHVALLLAAGYLDGIVRRPGELPHVVRGTARKKAYVHSEEETTDKDGKVDGTKTILRERIELVVRVVDAAGDIKTFGETKDDEE